MLQTLNNKPWCLPDEVGPVEYAKGFLPMINSATDEGDFEQAQGIKDAIVEFLNQFLPEEERVPLKKALLVLPDERCEPLQGLHISYIQNGDFLGPRK